MRPRRQPGRHSRSTTSWNRLLGSTPFRILAVTATAGLVLTTPGIDLLDASAAPSTTTTVLDPFNRSVTHGLGAAAEGGRWQLGGDARQFSVIHGAGHIALASPGRGASARLSDVSTANGDLVTALSVQEPLSGGGTYVSLQGRVVGNSDYRATLRFRSDGKVALYLGRRVDGREHTISGTYVPGLASRAGTSVNLRLSVTGTNPTRLAAKAWPTSGKEPSDWQLSTKDGSTRLQRAGTVGLVTYLSSSASRHQVVTVADVRSVATTAPSRPAPSGQPTTTPPAPVATSKPTHSTRPSSTTSRSSAPSRTTTATPTTPVPTSTSSTTPTTPSSSTTSRPAPTTTTTTTKPSPTTSTTTASTGMPGPGNTGVPSGTTLKVHNGDLSVTKAGTVIDGLDIRGFLTINAPNVTVRNSIIRGRSTQRQTNLVSSKQPGFVIEDSELAPSSPSPNIDGLKGYGFTARRLNIHDTVDGVFIYGSDTTVEHSWIHSNRHYQNDPNQGGTPSHDDSIQVQGGTNIRLIGNRIQGAFNAGLMITQDASRLSNVQFVGNWADGGGCTVNVAEKGRGPIQGLVVNNNRFGRNTRVPDCPVIAPSTTPMVAEGNVYADNGQPARIRRNG
jgi:hypothetical protein